ncbi:Ricin B lectin domain-containing protein [Pleurotus pulmonarius]
MSRFLRSALSLSVVALGLVPATLAVHFNVTNNCPNSLTLFINGENRGVLGNNGGNVHSDVPRDWSGDIWTSSYQGSASGDKSTRASFHLEEGYYFIVSDFSRFNTGVSIKPNRREDHGWCPEAKCDGPNCNTAYHSRPNHLPPPSNGPPGPPLYRCPGDVGFTVTFCPDGKPPQPAAQAGGDVHQIHPNGDNKKCLDVRSAAFQNGSPVQIHDCNGSNAQKWRITSKPGATRLQLDGTNFCLDSGLTPGNGVQLKIWQCYDNLAAQKWWYTEDKHIALEGKGQCLDLPGGNSGNGNVVQTWECAYGNKNQIWTL